MGSKLMEGLGVLAVLGLVGGSIAALALVKQKIHVTIAAEEEAARRGPDPLELMRADLGVLAGDVAAFDAGLAARLAELHGALETAAAERAQALAARIDGLQKELDSARASAVSRDATLLAAVRAELAALAARTPGAADVATVAAVPTPAVPEPAPVEPAPALEAAPRVPEAAPEVLAKKGFLSFKLPAATFAFGERQRFAIVPSLSRVGFDAKSTLHDFSGVTSQVDGELTVDLSKAGDRPLCTLTVDAAALDTGLPGRDEDMRKTLAVGEFKTLTFEWTGFAVDQVDARAMTVAGTATGKLTIRGVTREAEMPVQVAVDPSKRIAIDGETTIRLKDFGVAPPSQLGMIKVDDEVKIWIALRARFVGKATNGAADGATDGAADGAPGGSKAGK